MNSDGTTDALLGDIELVAHHALASAAEDIVAYGWSENYPEIGEYDWLAVSDRVKALSPYPDHDAYLAAYDRLTARADKDA